MCDISIGVLRGGRLQQPLLQALQMLPDLRQAQAVAHHGELPRLDVLLLIMYYHIESIKYVLLE